MQTTQIQIKGESKLIQGHVMDVSRPALLAALKRYDQQLYLKWNAKKQGGRGAWELRRRPELKSVKEGYYLEVPNKGKVGIPGDVFDMDGYTLVFPKYHESRADCVKTFEKLDYRILDWVAKQDLWQYGYKGKHFADEAQYKEAKFEEMIDDKADADRQYELKQMKTQINDFREYILAGGDPYRLLDYWK
jgi:hypothetical protein